MTDATPFKHGEEGTHSACNTRLKAEGTKCCVCVPHEGCDMNNNDTENQYLDKLGEESL